MDYEKAYKEALGRAKKLYDQGTITESLSYCFPELKESEDELTRKDLLEYVKHCVCYRDVCKEEKDKWIAWLEKQGQSKPTIPYKAIREGVAHFGITQYQIDNWLKKYVGIEGEGQSTFEQCKQEGDRIVENPDGTHFNLSQLERVAKAETPEESLCISTDEYNKVVNECIFGAENKSRWTEEDECYMGECISAVATKDGWSFEEKRKTKHWLKSIKQRIGE